MGKSLCIGSTEGYKIHEGFEDEEGIGGGGIAVCILLIPSPHTN